MGQSVLFRLAFKTEDTHYTPHCIYIIVSHMITMSTSERISVVQGEVRAHEEMIPRPSASPSRSTFASKMKRTNTDTQSNLYWEGIIDVTVSHWTFTMDELKYKTPSRIAKIDATTEISRRFKGIQYIVKCCRELKLSRSVGLTAAEYLHRFYMRKDINRYHYYEIAATSLFIACKAEECRRKLSDVVKVCARIASKQIEPIDEQSKVYWYWKDRIVKLEEKMLEVLCFEVTLTNPYKICMEELDYSDQPIPSQEEILSGTWLSKVKNVFGHAATLFEYTSRVPLSLLHDPYTIAALGVVVGAKVEKIVCPESLIRDKFSCLYEDLWHCYQDLIFLTKYLDVLDPNIINSLPKLTEQEIKTLVNDGKN